MDVGARTTGVVRNAERPPPVRPATRRGRRGRRKRWVSALSSGHGRVRFLHGGHPGPGLRRRLPPGGIRVEDLQPGRSKLDNHRERAACHRLRVLRTVQHLPARVHLHSARRPSATEHPATSGSSADAQASPLGSSLAGAQRAGHGVGAGSLHPARGRMLAPSRSSTGPLRGGLQQRVGARRPARLGHRQRSLERASGTRSTPQPPGEDPRRGKRSQLGFKTMSTGGTSSHPPQRERRPEAVPRGAVSKTQSGRCARRPSSRGDR